MQTTWKDLHVDRVGLIGAVINIFTYIYTVHIFSIYIRTLLAAIEDKNLDSTRGTTCY
jgi:hypothetical protein